MLERIKNRLSVELTVDIYYVMLRQFNQIVAHEAMVEHGGNLTRASKSLSLSRPTFTTQLGCSGKEWNEKFNDGKNPTRWDNHRWEK